ncbi:MAG: RNA-guided endonuclease TnpB family protein [bacterium]|nr:RNA-guided endonuclease TnpB family protein [bacterium]
MKAVIHRQPPADWVLKSATISQESDGKFYVSVLFEYKESIVPVPVSDTAIGLDYTSNGLYMDDKGNVGSHHKYYRESHKKLAKAQRKLSRMRGSKKNETKSNHYMKQLHKVNKIHRHIANQRLDSLHKKSTEIANQYDVVCVESLNMRSMSNKRFGNGKATMDNGYGLFLTMLEYKLAERGKYFVKVDKWFASSQICHCCGSMHPEMKDLSVRTMKCECGLVMSRDQNAAINIKKEGLRILRTAA